MTATTRNATVLPPVGTTATVTFQTRDGLEQVSGVVHSNAYNPRHLVIEADGWMRVIPESFIRSLNGRPFGEPVLDERDRRFLEAGFVTMSLTTRSGSRYLLIKRPRQVTVFHEGDGWVQQGTHLEVTGSGALVLWDGETRLMNTTPVKSIHVMEN